jgi:hypothetical protein
VSLRRGDGRQILLDTPRQDRDPQQLADAILEKLALGPAEWRAARRSRRQEA